MTNPICGHVFVRFPVLRIKTSFCVFRTLFYYKTCFIVVISFHKQALVFSCLQNKSFENTVGKREIARYKPFLHSVFYAFVELSAILIQPMLEESKMNNFSYFPQCFYPFGEISFIFVEFEIVVCNVFQFG